MEHSNIKKLQELYENNVSKPGLLRIIELTKRLGNPQNNIKCIHIAGTNGKGSTCAYLESVLRTAGYKTALFTSPHIYDLREYLRVENVQISEDEFDKYLGESFEVSEKMKSAGLSEPSFFEIITATAFKYFSDKEVDVAIIETGMGGIEDATNIIKPILSVITSISMDHMDYLGYSIKKIAQHKAGIIKEKTPLIFAPEQKREVKSVIKKKCKVTKSVYHEAKCKIEIYEQSLSHQAFFIKTDIGVYRIRLNVPGFHQAQNVSTVLYTINKLNELGFEISYADTKTGLYETRPDSRTEYIKDKNILIDASHNADGVAQLNKVIYDNVEEKKVVLICAVSSTKDVKSMVNGYRQFADYVLVTQSKHKLAMKSIKLSTMFNAAKVENEICTDIESALVKAKSISESENALIVISGSFYIIAEAKEAINSVYYQN